MSPRHVLPRASSKNYAPAVRHCLPANQPAFSWQAKAVIGCLEWHVVTPSNELVAIVLPNCPSNGERVVINKTAWLMADAPQLLNELKHAHDMLSEVFLELMARDEADYSLLKRLSSRVRERLPLLSTYRHFIANKERGHE